MISARKFCCRPFRRSSWMQWCVFIALFQGNVHPWRWSWL